MLPVLFSALTAAVLGVVAAESLDYAKVHLVDHATLPSGVTNFFFRGNMPVNDSGTPTFAYDELVQFMGQRAQAAGLAFPADPYIIDISLCNVFDGATYAAEAAFWKSANASLGQYLNWEMGIAGLLPPTLYSESTALEMANGSVWAFDQVPARIVSLRSMLMQVCVQ